MIDFIKGDEELADLCRDGLMLIQKKDLFKFGTDAVLLSYFASEVAGKKIIDLCTGSGVVPILLSSKTNAEKIVGVEIQESIADMAKRSVLYNHLEGRIEIVEDDLKNIECKHNYDTVTCNPPYMKLGTAIVNEKSSKTISRHEVFCTFEDVVKTAAGQLRDKGHFVVVHRPSRLADVIYLMKKYKIEPKRLRMVYSDITKQPSLFLADGIYNGGSELKILPPLITKNSDGTDSDELIEIYGNDR